MVWKKSVLAGVAVTCLAGCGESLRSPEGTVPVSGVVKYNDQPVEDALVEFIPQKGPKAIGTTDADGNFTLTTTLKNDGAVVGEHRVAVTKREAMDPDHPYETPKSLIPDKYSSTRTSGLKQSVAEKTSDIAIDLKD